MSGLKLADVIKTVRWNAPPPLSMDDESTVTRFERRHVVTNDDRTVVTNDDRTDRLDRLKEAFLTDLPLMLEGKSIAQTIAGFERREALLRHEGNQSNDGAKPDMGDKNPYRVRGGIHPAFNASERVVRSHLRYLNDFEPFRNGVFSLSSLYEFLFYMIVERGRRESYTKRVIKSIMAYLKAGGALATRDLSEESKKYIEDFRGMGGVKFSTFYKRMDALTNSLNDDQTKRLLSTARRKRALVFNDDEESRILCYCIRMLRASIRKYIPVSASEERTGKRLWSTSADHYSASKQQLETLSDTKIQINTDIAASDTRPSRVGYERTIFEFSFAYILGFLSGARIKSTILKLSIEDVKTLLAGALLEVLTKGAFVNVFLPATVLQNDSDLYSHITGLRIHSLLYKDSTDRRTGQEPAGFRGNDRFFTRSSRQLELMLDRVYKSLYSDRTRTKGVRWHSQRRRYLGTINSKYGAATASDSVGHRDLSTTMAYINNSLHMDDVRSRAGEAITERYDMILTQ